MESIHDLASYDEGWRNSDYGEPTFMGMPTKLRRMIYKLCHPEPEVKFICGPGPYDMVSTTGEQALVPFLSINKKIRSEFLDEVEIGVHVTWDNFYSPYQWKNVKYIIGPDVREKLVALYFKVNSFYPIMEKLVRGYFVNRFPYLENIYFQLGEDFNQAHAIDDGQEAWRKKRYLAHGKNGIPILETPIPHKTRHAYTLPHRVTIGGPRPCTFYQIFNHLIEKLGIRLHFVCAVGPFELADTAWTPHWVPEILALAVSYPFLFISWVFMLIISRKSHGIETLV